MRNYVYIVLVLFVLPNSRFLVPALAEPSRVGCARDFARFSLNPRDILEAEGRRALEIRRDLVDLSSQKSVLTVLADRNLSFADSLLADLEFLLKDGGSLMVKLPPLTAADLKALTDYGGIKALLSRVGKVDVKISDANALESINHAISDFNASLAGRVRVSRGESFSSKLHALESLQSLLSDAQKFVPHLQNRPKFAEIVHHIDRAVDLLRRSESEGIAVRAMAMAELGKAQALLKSARNDWNAYFRGNHSLVASDLNALLRREENLIASLSDSEAVLENARRLVDSEPVPWRYRVRAALPEWRVVARRYPRNRTYAPSDFSIGESVEVVLKFNGKVVRKIRGAFYRSGEQEFEIGVNVSGKVEIESFPNPGVAGKFEIEIRPDDSIVGGQIQRRWLYTRGLGLAAIASAYFLFIDDE